MIVSNYGTQPFARSGLGMPMSSFQTAQGYGGYAGAITSIGPNTLAANSIGLSRTLGVPPLPDSAPLSARATALGAPTTMTTAREQALEQRVRELENMVSQKDKIIQELQIALRDAERAGGGTLSSRGKGSVQAPRSPGRAGSASFRKVADAKPVIQYAAVDQEDPVDIRLEEFYNTTGSAIQFRRINKEFYRFGDSIVELKIINHKLMAKTEDGWNRGKFGPIEKFLMYYENIEREKAGILPEA